MTLSFTTSPLSGGGGLGHATSPLAFGGGEGSAQAHELRGGVEGQSSRKKSFGVAHLHNELKDVATCDDELDDLPDSASAFGDGMQSVASTSMTKKASSAAATAVIRSAELDGVTAMKAGKQGVKRHQTQLFLQACERDEQKRNLPEVLALKSKFKVYDKAESLGPETIHDIHFQQLPGVMLQVLKVWEIPDEPYMVRSGFSHNSSDWFCCEA